MARPKKNPEDKKGHSVHIRVNDEDYEMLKTAVKLLGYGSLTGCIVGCVRTATTDPEAELDDWYL